jgi:soluble lytic murein transglycosylase-like protein
LKSTEILVAALAGAFLSAALLLCAPRAFGQEIPRAAVQYRHALTSSARLVWGLNAPVATFAGQVHQESAWRADARSPYADGLAQFTPATAEWIGDVYPDLAARQPFNPAWALRALVRYDRFLWTRNPAATECDRMAFALASYNGGEGWLRREQARAAAKGADRLRWFAHVERHCIRADWACRENRDYPRKILLKHQLVYTAWGLATAC